LPTEADLTKLVAAILSVFVLVVGLDTRHAQAQDGVITFKFTNNARYTVYMKMYSSSRNLVWPGANIHYILDDSSQRAARLSCQVGEKICYGGGYQTDGTGSYWGVGYLGKESCQGCCLVCGTLREDGSHSWNLTD
jgi:hypothetical protein